MSEPGDYSKMTDQDFDNILLQVLKEKTAEQILATPGAYEVFSEEYNNEVLDRWDKLGRVQG